MKTTTNIIYSALALLACFVLSPQARAVCQEGCLTNQNTVLGEDALISSKTGTDNTAIGFEALNVNTTGYQNTATGSYALLNNTTGVGNTAIGFNALLSDTTGFGNTAIGWSALLSNTTGEANTATGVGALYYNTTGVFNTATGNQALQFNTTGSDNTANGFFALVSNTTGFNNTAIGDDTLLSNTTGFDNTALGSDALSSNKTGNHSSASGASALFFNTTGDDNTANGVNALLNNTTGNKNTGDGIAALAKNTTGSGNIALGNGAGGNLTIGDHNIDIGNAGQAGESSAIRIGRVEDHTATYIAGIAGATVPTGVAVIVNANGHLGTTTSSARYKEAIKPMDKASEAILALEPVTFRYKHELDPEGVPQFGLVAEQVETVDADLVARDRDGKPYSVRYEAVNAMLLNEFLKEHRTVQDLKATASKQEATIAQQQKQIEALTAGLQKVSAQLEVSKSAPQTVLNSQ